MISKELLSEVMSIKIEDIVDLKMFGKDLKYYEKCLLKSCCDGRLSKHKDSICKSINIYELAHKCKEWAIKQHKIDLITLELDKNEKTINCSILYGEIHPNMKMYYFNADTEIEAIFKACQWILDSKKEGN